MKLNLSLSLTFVDSNTLPTHFHLSWIPAEVLLGRQDEILPKSQSSLHRPSCKWVKSFSRLASIVFCEVNASQFKILRRRFVLENGKSYSCVKINKYICIVVMWIHKKRWYTLIRTWMCCSLFGLHQNTEEDGHLKIPPPLPKSWASATFPHFGRWNKASQCYFPLKKIFYIWSDVQLLQCYAVFAKYSL